MKDDNMKFINIEEELYKLHNKIREDPQSFIEQLENSKKYYKDNKVYYPEGEQPIQTYEGKEGVDETILYLKKQNQVKRLEKDDYIKKACEDHIKDIGERGMTSHIGSNGSTISDRLEKYCEWEGACGESLDFGFNKAENIIINLLVDDGVTNKAQRKNFFNENFEKIGIAVGSHKTYGICVCIGYAKYTRDKSESPKNVSNYIIHYINSNNQKKTKEKNSYQIDDPDAPDDTESVKLVKRTIKKDENTEIKVTQKIYNLKSGEQYIVEIED